MNALGEIRYGSARMRRRDSMKDARTDPSSPSYYKSTIIGLLRTARKHGLSVTLTNGPDGAKINFVNEMDCSSINLLPPKNCED